VPGEHLMQCQWAPNTHQSGKQGVGQSPLSLGAQEEPWEERTREQTHVSAC